MSSPRALHLGVQQAALLVALLAAACSCQQPGTSDADAAPDAAPPDAAPDSALHDAVPDQLPDWPGRHCVLGTERALVPVQVEPYLEGGKPCGAGCKQISFGNNVNLDYEFVDDTIVYVGERSLPPAMPYAVRKVYYVDLAAGKEWRLHDESLRIGQISGCLRVSADGEALGYACTWDWYEGEEPYTMSFSRYNLKTHQEVEKHCQLIDPSKDLCAPSWFAMGADGMAYNMGLSECRFPEVLLHRYGTPGVTSLGSDPAKIARYPHMDGHYLAFSTGNADTGSLNIVLYDTRTGEQRFIAPHAGNQYWPRIAGSKVVWTDLRNQTSGSMWPTHGDIYLYDMASDTVQPVTTHSARQELADVWGDIVAWVDYRNDPTPNTGGTGSNWDIYFKDLASGQTYQLTSEPGYESMPRVDNGRISYIMPDARNNPSLFLVDVKTWIAAQQ